MAADPVFEMLATGPETGVTVAGPCGSRSWVRPLAVSGSQRSGIGWVDQHPGLG